MRLEAADGPLEAVRRLSGPVFAGGLGAVGDYLPTPGAYFSCTLRHDYIDAPGVTNVHGFETQDMGVALQRRRTRGSSLAHRHSLLALGHVAALARRCRRGGRI